MNGTVTALGVLGTGASSYATAVSNGGSVVVGGSQDNSSSPNEAQAFMWTGGVMSGLGFLPSCSSAPCRSAATGVSADGSVVVGYAYYGSSNVYEAFRFTSNTMTGLGFMSGGSSSVAFGVSADGSVIVGQANTPNNTIAVEWVNGTLTSLGFLPGGNTSYAQGVSGDGSVVVGYSSHDFSGEDQAFRWTNGTMKGLGFLQGGDQSYASAANADGSVVVGYGLNNNRMYRTVRWTRSGGMRAIDDLLIAAGVNITDWQLNQATGVSADGTTIVGYGTDPNGN